MNEWRKYDALCACGKTRITASIRGPDPKFYCPDCKPPANAQSWANGWSISYPGESILVDNPIAIEAP